MKPIIQWRVTKGHDRRLRAGHPWLFSNQLSHSPKGIEPGTPVELVSDRDEFLAFGYGNPHSLIAFRAISFSAKERDFFSSEALAGKIISAWKYRAKQGFTTSFRVVFSEADALPGLVVDRFDLGHEQVLAFQVLTAGMERWLSDAVALFHNVVQAARSENLCPQTWEQTFLVERKDTSVRKLESLEVQEPCCLQAPPDIANVEGFLSNAKVRVQGEKEIHLLYADLLHGQKTGFFLDQSWNMRLLQQALATRQDLPSPFRILDLCCYVGHWSLQIAASLKARGVTPVVDLVDVSEEALARASRTLKEAGIEHHTHKVDVMKDLERWPAGEFDLLVVDPPAFAKSRKDLPNAEHAYLKLNTEAFRKTRDHSLVVSCSCSGLVEEDVFAQTLAKALRRSGRRGYWIARGGQGFDHPIAPGFPEGKYLKMILTQIRL